MTITALAKSKSSAIQLSDKEREKGVEILNSLQTVERAKRYGDPINLAASNVVRNEQQHPEFVQLMQKAAGVKSNEKVATPVQKAIVEDLLVLCYETS